MFPKLPAQGAQSCFLSSALARTNDGPLISPLGTLPAVALFYSMCRMGPRHLLADRREMSPTGLPDAELGDDGVSDNIEDFYLVALLDF